MHPPIDYSQPRSSEVLSPAHTTLLAYERLAQVRGNENLGYLSRSQGALPLQAPKLRLGEAHRAWDDLALALPSLLAAGQHRSALASLPLLDTRSEVLPESDLPRAALLLAVFAHSYAPADRKSGGELPLAIQQPWTHVSQRLGRKKAFLSYNDLIAYNWRYTGNDPNAERTVENLRLLVPTVDNDEEHRFYLTQVEILARSTPLLQAVIAAQDAVLRRDIPALEEALQIICQVLRTICQVSLPKIAPHPRHRSHVNPVVWARTVAPFAVPIDSSVPGPSGTSSLLFHILDVFLERERYQTFLGKEALHLRSWFPEAHQAFLKALAHVSVAQFVEAVGTVQTKALLDELRETYFGASGFLGLHRRKVYGYLEVAFKVGRSHTIGGFSGTFADREWEEVDRQLECSRQERHVGSCPHLSLAPPLKPEVEVVSVPGEPSRGAGVMPSEVLRHRSLATGAWVQIGEAIYDLSDYLRAHPGGPIVLQQYLGADATVPFHAVGHDTDSRILRSLERYRIGTLAPMPDDKRYVVWRKFALFLTQLLNSFELEQEALGRQWIGNTTESAALPDDDVFRQEQCQQMVRRFFELDIKGAVVPAVTALAREAGLGPVDPPTLPAALTRNQLHEYLRELHKSVVDVLQRLESPEPFCPVLLHAPLRRTQALLEVAK